MMINIDTKVQPIMSYKKNSLPLFFKFLDQLNFIKI
jgi:hypothetical protein